MQTIPMSHADAEAATDDWLALRDVWAEVAEADQADALAYFQLSEDTLLNGTRAQLIASYEAFSPRFPAIVFAGAGALHANLTVSP